MPRYQIQNHPGFEGLLSKEDLYLLVERGSLARGDICLDTRTGRSHKLGELIGGMAPPRGGAAGSRIERPAYQEIRADGLIAEEEDELADTEPAEEDAFPRTAGGERIRYHAHPSWLSYAKALLLVVLLAIAAGLGSPFGTKYLIVGLTLASGVLMAIAAIRFSRDYLVTDERVEVVWGIIGRSSKEVRIQDIRAIDVHERGLAGLLGIGTVDFSSAGNAGVEVQFHQIRKAHSVKELVRDLQRNATEE